MTVGRCWPAGTCSMLVVASWRQLRRRRGRQSWQVRFVEVRHASVLCRRCALLCTLVCLAVWRFCLYAFDRNQGRRHRLFAACSRHRKQAGSQFSDALALVLRQSLQHCQVAGRQLLPGRPSPRPSRWSRPAARLLFIAPAPGSCATTHICATAPACHRPCCCCSPAAAHRRHKAQSEACAVPERRPPQSPPLLLWRYSRCCAVSAT